MSDADSGTSEACAPPVPERRKKRRRVTYKRMLAGAMEQGTGDEEAPASCSPTAAFSKIDQI